MQKYRPWVLAAFAVLVITSAAAAFAYRAARPTPLVMSAPTVAFSCDHGQNIVATFASSSARLQLSDGRTLTLLQGLSGSGTRYTAGNVSFITKGDDAFLTEGDATTYANCLAGTKGPDGKGMQTFTDQGRTFRFTHPAALPVTGAGVGYSQDWSASAGPSSMGMVLARLTIPASFEPKTNFNSARLTVGTSAQPADVASCTKAPEGATAAGTVTINGTTYTKITGTDAGAGNLFETTSYRTVRNDQCYSVEYVIHYANMGMYDPSQGITAFDKQKVVQVMEGIVQSFTFIQ